MSFLKHYLLQQNTLKRLLKKYNLTSRKLVGILPLKVQICDPRPQY